MLRYVIACVLVVASSVESFAQKGKAPAGSGPVELSVKQVNDRRGGQFFERLELVVELSGVTAGEVSAARVLLRSAVDDSGRSLIAEDASELPLQETGGSRFEDDEDRKKPARLSFSLESPARTASTVREITGDVELYMPSKDPNSVALIPKFLSSKGKALSHKALKANGVEISMVSEQQFEAEKKRLAGLKRQEMAKEGYPEESITSILESFLEYFPTPEPNDVVVKIKDPRKAIHEVSYVDAEGQTKRVSLQENEGFTFLSTWEGAPEAGWSLRVNMKTPKNVVRRPFILKGVALP